MAARLLRDGVSLLIWARYSLKTSLLSPLVLSEGGPGIEFSAVPLSHRRRGLLTTLLQRPPRRSGRRGRPPTLRSAAAASSHGRVGSHFQDRGLSSERLGPARLAQPAKRPLPV